VRKEYNQKELVNKAIEEQYYLFMNAVLLDRQDSKEAWRTIVAPLFDKCSELIKELEEKTEALGDVAIKPILKQNNNGGK